MTLRNVVLICLILFDAFVLPSVNDDALSMTVSKAIFPNRRLHRRTRATPLLPDSDTEDSGGEDKDLVKQNEKHCVKRNPCRNGGTCVERPSSTPRYKCICPLGYNGKYCKSKLPECDNEPCKDRGECVATPGGFVCVCKNGFGGKMCEYRPGTSFLNDEDIKFVIKKDVFEIIEIVLLCSGILLVIITLAVVIHCRRVNVVRSRIREVLQDRIEHGEKITSLPPGLLEVSNKLFHDVICCKTDIKWEELLGFKAGSVTHFIPGHSKPTGPIFGFELPKRDLWKKHLNILQSHLAKDRQQSKSDNVIPRSSQNWQTDRDKMEENHVQLNGEDEPLFKSDETEMKNNPLRN